MRHAARTLSTILLVAVGLSSIATDAVARQHRLTTVGSITVLGGSDADLESVRWAVDRFSRGGLELPQVVVAFDESDRPCDGHDGLFRNHGGVGRIDVCTHNRYIVLHELAHAWEQANLTDEERAAFMAQRGVEAWNDKSRPWKERGVEALAEVITWGLYDHPVAGSTEKAEAFLLITGREPRQRAANAAATVQAGARPDDWDELR